MNYFSSQPNLRVESRMVGSSLAYKYLTTVVVTGNVEHSSLLWHIMNYLSYEPNLRVESHMVGSSFAPKYYCRLEATDRVEPSLDNCGTE